MPEPFHRDCGSAPKISPEMLGAWCSPAVPSLHAHCILKETKSLPLQPARTHRSFINTSAQRQVEQPSQCFYSAVLASRSLQWAQRSTRCSYVSLQHLAGNQTTAWQNVAPCLPGSKIGYVPALLQTSGHVLAVWWNWLTSIDPSQTA